jgi:hypothetical protein
VAVDASGVSRRYAFVQYEKEEEAEKAIDVMDQIKILVSSTLNTLLNMQQCCGTVTIFMVPVPTFDKYRFRF